MSNVKKGDTPDFKFIVKEKGNIVDIQGATVKVVIKAGVREFEKDAIVSDGQNGVCEISLTSDDLSSSGVYKMQGKVKMINNKSFSSDEISFMVEDTL